MRKECPFLMRKTYQFLRKAAIRAWLRESFPEKGFRIGSGTLEKLEAEVCDMLLDALKRAEANKRKTIQPWDI